MATSPSPGPRATPYLIFLILITTLGPLQFGYHLAELNAPQAVITCEKKDIKLLRNLYSSSASSGLPRCIPMNPSQFGLVSSSYSLGGLLGALLAGPFSTKYGRLLALRGTTIFLMLGPVAEALSVSIPVFVLGRLLSGIGAGAAIVVGPIYIAEISPPKDKGFYGAFTQVMTNVGILGTQSLGYFLSKGSLWRIILATAGFIGLAELLGLLFVPESPVWLAEHQRLAHAKRILQRIRGQNADIHDEVKSWQIGGSTASRTDPLEEESLLTPPPGNLPPRKPPVSILGVARDPLYRRAIIAVVAVMVTQQFTGINSIIMYSVSLLSTILPTTAALLTVIVSSINLFTTLLCSPLADKLGRKRCLLLSITGMGLSSALLAISIASNLKILSAIATLLFVASFAVGLGPVPFILASELVGPEAVGATQSWGLATNWTATFVVAQFFPVLNVALGGKGRVYWIFAAIALFLGGFIAWWVPETKGKGSMEEVWGKRAERRVD
ncbi:Sugar transporter family protein [Coccidioides posadasii C735 delta SOWgp]|uniref:Sugar transporter family protein n=1 Tax=Coccidioides posadasii (strain C735) TaxID=222929 RepID=C5PFK4_COCP7|nr:Sugar transporter family protein [Coccidioides posadasii C735 delta SOWgp]EER24693.1 Sugar transporter family protein [Coccidioides posadasii C735 delta SOWgp]|eukprot:XP_003066838.1 Sugar transporter family protein [Coccidioides posadasii C735 delta SOWgp]